MTSHTRGTLGDYVIFAKLKVNESHYTIKPVSQLSEGIHFVNYLDQGIRLQQIATMVGIARVQILYAPALVDGILTWCHLQRRVLSIPITLSHCKNMQMLKRDFPRVSYFKNDAGTSREPPSTVLAVINVIQKRSAQFMHNKCFYYVRIK